MAAVSTGQPPPTYERPPFGSTRRLLEWWAGQGAVRAAGLEAGTPTTLAERQDREALRAAVVLALREAEREVDQRDWALFEAHWRGGRSEHALVDVVPAKTADAARKAVGRALSRAEWRVTIAATRRGLVP